MARSTSKPGFDRNSDTYKMASEVLGDESKSASAPKPPHAPHAASAPPMPHAAGPIAATPIDPPALAHAAPEATVAPQPFHLTCPKCGHTAPR